MNIKSVLESLLFAWGEPLNLSEISSILNMPEQKILHVLTSMIEEYQNDENRGLIIQKYGSTFQLTTKKENYMYIENLLQTTVNKNLSNAAMEIMSIIAYKQPVTRVEIEMIRGVKCANVLKGLLDKKLIKEAGKLDKPGKPTLYATTDEFLRHFGLNSLNELPSINIEPEEEKAT